MITLTILATLAVLAPLLWLLVETSRKRWLAWAVPILVALPLAFFWYGSSLLGYAVSQSLPAAWTLVHASIDDRTRTVYLLVREPDKQPRLYLVTADFERARKEAGKAQALLDKGVLVRGQRGADDNEGEFVFYVLPPSAVVKG